MNLVRRRIYNDTEDYVITAKDTPKLMAALYSKGYAASPKGMTRKECEAVYSLSSFSGIDLSGENFDALEYFKNITILTRSGFNDTKLKSVKLPPNLKTIQDDCFRLCSFYNGFILIIPATVTSIGDRAINYQNWTGSINYVFLRKTPITLDKTSISRLSHIYVPDESFEDYIEAWGNITFNNMSAPASNYIKRISELNQ